MSRFPLPQSRRQFVFHSLSFMGLSLAALTGCGKSSSPSKTRLALNWKPDPQFGGFYAADFAAAGLDVDILPGGAGTPTVQMVGSGAAEFGIVSADEILLARSKGNDVVALFAVFQNNPQGIMVHAERKIESIEGVLQSGTLALQSGLPYARMLQRKYGFDKVKIVPSPGGDLTAFFNDKNFAQQCFVTGEPLLARKRGAEVKVFPVSDIGYNPYTTVLAASGDLVRKNADLAKKMVDAVRQGWRAYLDNPQPANAKMQALNPSMDPQTYADVAAAQKPLIETTPLGKMTKERWETLAAQLKELGDIPPSVSVSDCYREL